MKNFGDFSEKEMDEVYEYLDQFSFLDDDYDCHLCVSGPAVADLEDSESLECLQEHRATQCCSWHEEGLVLSTGRLALLGFSYGH